MLADPSDSDGSESTTPDTNPKNAADVLIDKLNAITTHFTGYDVATSPNTTALLDALQYASKRLDDPDPNKSDTSSLTTALNVVSGMFAVKTDAEPNAVDAGLAQSVIDNAVNFFVPSVTTDGYTPSSAVDTAIKNADTTASPYSQEEDVARALAKIKDLPSTATDADKQAAIDALTAAVTAAKPLRDDANTAATTAAGTVTGDLANNPTVTVAQTALQDAVTAAANNTGSTGAITTATTALTNAVEAANAANTALANAKDTAKPYSQETEVQTALDNSTLPAKATTDQIKAAADNLTKQLKQQKLRVILPSQMPRQHRAMLVPE